MPATGVSSLGDALAQSKDQLLLCWTTLLAWVAASDKSISPQETTALYEITQNQDPDDFRLSLALGQRGHADDLAHACSVLRKLQQENRQTFMRAAITIAWADGELASPEIYALRFLADVTEINLDALHAAVMKKNLPVPSDTSSVQWWEARHEASNASEAEAPQASAATGMTRSEALSVLGLGMDASESDIRKAFLRLADIHHPDRFGEKGDEKAAEIFRRIKDAYDTLK